MPAEEEARLENPKVERVPVPAEREATLAKSLPDELHVQPPLESPLANPQLDCIPVSAETEAPLAKPKTNAPMAKPPPALPIIYSHNATIKVTLHLFVTLVGNPREEGSV